MLPRFQTLERKVNLGDKFFIINSLRLKRQVFLRLVTPQCRVF